MALTVWLPRPVLPSPLVPVPLEAKLIATLPPFAPADVVLKPSTRFVLAEPAVNCVTDPLEVSPVARLPKLALRASLQPSVAAVFVTESVCCTLSPTWWLPKLTVEAIGLAEASRYPAVALKVWLPSPGA